MLNQEMEDVVCPVEYRIGNVCHISGFNGRYATSMALSGGGLLDTNMTRACIFIGASLESLGFECVEAKEEYDGSVMVTASKDGASTWCKLLKSEMHDSVDPKLFAKRLLVKAVSTHEINKALVVFNAVSDKLLKVNW